MLVFFALYFTLHGALPCRLRLFLSLSSRFEELKHVRVAVNRFFRRRHRRLSFLSKRASSVRSVGAQCTVPCRITSTDPGYLLHQHSSNPSNFCRWSLLVLPSSRLRSSHQTQSTHATGLVLPTCNILIQVRGVAHFLYSISKQLRHSYLWLLPDDP